MTKIAIGLCVAFLGAGCAARPALPGSERILLSREPAARHCRFLAEVRGSQGNFWTAEFTPDSALIAGARNDLRNAALTIGADYVKIESESYSHNTGDDSLGGVYSAVVIGNAYRCQETAQSVP